MVAGLNDWTCEAGKWVGKMESVETATQFGEVNWDIGNKN